MALLGRSMLAASGRPRVAVSGIRRRCGECSQGWRGEGMTTEDTPPAPHPIKGDELRAVLEGTASMTARETVDVLNARGLLTPYGKLWDMVLVKVWRRRFGIKS
jgi:hypothetical protein